MREQVRTVEHIAVIRPPKFDHGQPCGEQEIAPRVSGFRRTQQLDFERVEIGMDELQRTPHHACSPNIRWYAGRSPGSELQLPAALP
jgi:hypothetical protein